MVSICFSNVSAIANTPRAAKRLPKSNKQTHLKRCNLAVCATEDNEAPAPTATETSEAPPSLTFQSNTRARRGFTENDSAGQTNIFAVEPRTYVQGSAADNTEGSNSLALAGGAVALTFIFGGLLILDNGTPGVSESSEAGGQYLRLLEYKAKFQSEIASNPVPAPALVSEVVPVEAAAVSDVVTLEEPAAVE